MTRKRRYLIAAAVRVACVCLVLGVLAMMLPGPSVTKANFDRIEKGMTFADVKGLLGDTTRIAFKDGNIEGALWGSDDDVFLACRSMPA